jgi:hypothetical protein
VQADSEEDVETAETVKPAVDYRCRAGKRCVARCGQDAAATVKPSTLCASCISDLQESRDRLVAARDAVKVFIGIKPVTALQSKIAPTKQPASPLNLAADTLMGEIDDVLSRVGNLLVRDLVSKPATRFKVWQGDYEQIIYWDGVTLALQIGSVYRKAVKLLGFEQQWQRRAAPCWSCEMPFLGQFSGSETVECSNCGERKTFSDYQEYCLDIFRGK